MLIDLHCHSLPRSRCSSLQPLQLVELARARGLDGICFTEHDAFWQGDELAALRVETGFPIFSGIELTTDAGHVLAFGLESSAVPLATAAALFEVALAANALLFLAHPARDGLLRVTPETLTRFDSLETHNGSDSRLQNAAILGIVRGFRLPGIGGSDAHTAAEVGRAATRFSAPITDDVSLVAALRAGAYEAVYLQP